jgi:hypothetical protein
MWGILMGHMDICTDSFSHSLSMFFRIASEFSLHQAAGTLRMASTLIPTSDRLLPWDFGWDFVGFCMLLCERLSD